MLNASYLPIDQVKRVKNNGRKLPIHERLYLKEENANWLLNLKWQMTGVDVHVDTNIGKHITALGQTLTTLTGKSTILFFDSFDGRPFLGNLPGNLI